MAHVSGLPNYELTPNTFLETRKPPSPNYYRNDRVVAWHFGNIAWPRCGFSAKRDDILFNTPKTLPYTLNLTPTPVLPE